MRDLLVYSVLRLAVFAALWWVLAHIGLGFYLAGLVAALLAMLISILFLGRPRERAAERWQRADERRRARRGPVRDEDADAEDDLVGAEAETSARESVSTGSTRVEPASEREAHQQEK